MKNIINVPSGTKNLAIIFNTVDFNLVDEYYIQVLSQGYTVIATSPVYKIKDCEDNLRIHFLNSLGEMEALNFKKTDVQHETKSENYRSGLPGKEDHDISRTGIVANDIYAGVCTMDEKNTGFYDELFDTPLAYLELDNMYLPIVILDKKSVKFKSDDRFFYEITVEFKLSHEKITIR